MISIERLGSDRAKECVGFYTRVITEAPHMDRYGRWKLGLYPTGEDLGSYIEKGAMYALAEDGAIAGAMALTLEQGGAYPSVDWSLPLADDEVAVMHVLAVDPARQGKGLGKRLIDEAVAIARKNGKKALRLDALASNTPAHRLYTEKGFVYRGTQNLYAANTGWTDFFFFELEI